jgi:hypothetical protein
MNGLGGQAACRRARFSAHAALAASLGYILATSPKEFEVPVLALSREAEPRLGRLKQLYGCYE